MSKTTTQRPRSVRRERGRHAGAAIPLCPMVRRQPVETNSGAESHLQPVEDPMLKQGPAPPAKAETEGGPH